ncbi:formylglycine-generating enzyme family protein [Pseudoduganella chitinolytica]|uniref:Formylglycine-generating enzyme family protein n=1 Tax=Pseudoduganella chitinolytica TaxID=34070 RepID=A0ABY8BEE7_9BURK|nr:formylglycine-generating enzyme family protein [Pseudoduganella chitinolytica]WEF34076.1 formylglycine-generating enzyme family protein [Pseudoduganella chitinolytica]
MKNIFLAFSLAALAASSGPALAGDNVITPPMVTIKGGQFLMGSLDNPKDDNYPTSEPVHAVKIKSFRLSKYETTVKQFRQFVEATGYRAAGDCWKLAANDWGMEAGPVAWDSPVNAPTDYHPVMCVSWNDAHAYVQWLSRQTGKQYRLPSEAEWEYAARAGSNARYPFGNDPAALCKYANVFDRSGKAAITRLTGKSRDEVNCDDGAGLTSVVGMYAPNAFGLHDMLGNVGEFVEDCQHLTYEGAPADGSAWTSACAAFHGGAMAIHRGGGYNNGAVGASPTYRGHAGLDNRSSLGEGFRIAETIEGEPKQKSRDAKAAQQSAFEAGLASAQHAERISRGGAKASPK